MHCTVARDGPTVRPGRPGGWSWLVDLNTDKAMVCAVVDVAHNLVERFLAPRRSSASPSGRRVCTSGRSNRSHPETGPCRSGSSRRPPPGGAPDCARGGPRGGGRRSPADLGPRVGAQILSLIDDNRAVPGQVASQEWAEVQGPAVSAPATASGALPTGREVEGSLLRTSERAHRAFHPIARGFPQTATTTASDAPYRRRPHEPPPQ